MTNSHDEFVLQSGELPPYLWHARYCYDAGSAVHIPLVFWMIDVLRPNRALVLGADDGNMHFAICQAIDKLNLVSQCYGIGVWSDTSTSSIESVLEASNFYGPISRIERVKDPMDEVNVVGQNHDFVLIDSSALIDIDSPRIELLASTIDAHSALAIRGSAGSQTAQKVTTQLVSLLPDHAPLTFNVGDGFTILCPAHNAPERLLSIVAASKVTSASSIADALFQQLGRAIIDRKASASPSFQISILNDKLNSVELELAATSARQQEVLDALEARNNELWPLQSKLHDMKFEIVKLKQAIDVSAETVERMKGENETLRASSEKNIYEKESVLTKNVDLSDEIVRVRAENATLRDQLQGSAADNNEKSDELLQLQTSLNERHREIALLVRRCEEMRLREAEGRDQLNSIKAQLDVTAQRLDYVEANWSWNLMRPLRTIVRRLTGRR